MTDRKPLAGGCFLTICILGGFFVGLAIRNPMKGVLIGTGIGIVLAVALWLIDVAVDFQTILRPAQITRPIGLIWSIPQSGQSG